jgi:hypothetical protein
MKHCFILLHRRKEERKSMTQSPFKPILLGLFHQDQTSQKTFIQELTPAERAALGTPQLWAAKDLVAHMTFWRQHLVLKLQAFLLKEPLLETEDLDQRNALLFEQQRARPWSDILAESDQVYTELLALFEQLSEEDFNRVDLSPDGEPLSRHIMGNFLHYQGHLAQYAAERGDLEHAVEIYEVWVQSGLEAGAPDTQQGMMLYNLACFYATHALGEKAWTPLQQSFALYPLLREVALTDPDLVEFHLKLSSEC